MVSAALSPDALLADLDPEQREVASRPLGAMCVLAGAGTGKTRAITHRLAYGVAAGELRADKVLALTFTARAAGEMRTRLRGLGLPTMQARTFHAAALRQLQYFWPRVVGGAPPQILSHKAPVVAEAASRVRLQLDRVGLRDAAAEIEWGKVNMLTADAYPASAARASRQVADLDATAMARLWRTYEELKTERVAIDFEDVLLLMNGILAEREDVAREVHDQYRHFVVDEYQDVNTVQQELLHQWLGGRDDLCVVGDPAQTIYSFTGASPRHLLEFTKRHPGAAVVRLQRNYRSTPQIVTLANRVIGRGQEHVQLQAQSGDGPMPRLLTYPDDPAEAAGVAQEIKGLLGQGVPASQIAVLYRINAQSEPIEQALTDADIPFLVRGGERFFNRDEVRRALVLLRGAVRSDNPERPLPEVVGDALAGAGLTTVRPTGGAALERWQSLDALVQLSTDLSVEQPEARLRDFVTELDRRAGEQHPPTVQGVTLASLHAAKGLEWDAVVIIGCSDGMLPLSMAEGPDEIAEERRLAYVGVTRARRHLLLSYALARNPGGAPSRSRSRFLYGAAGAIDGVADQPVRPAAKDRPRKAGARAATRCRSCGEPLTVAAQRKIGRCAACPPTYDETLFERLRTWRSLAANGKPAYIVFTDATLIAIAQDMPADLDSLARISGVGERKLRMYGDAVLAVLDGDDPTEVAEKHSAATE